ncbi:MAG: hypothetical protein ACKV2Q_03090 [Planctomycetaceae bacterium]
MSELEEHRMLADFCWQDYEQGTAQASSYVLRQAPCHLHAAQQFNVGDHTTPSPIAAGHRADRCRKYPTLSGDQSRFLSHNSPSLGCRAQTHLNRIEYSIHNMASQQPDLANCEIDAARLACIGEVRAYNPAFQKWPKSEFIR